MKRAGLVTQIFDRVFVEPLQVKSFDGKLTLVGLACARIGVGNVACCVQEFRQTIE